MLKNKILRLVSKSALSVSEMARRLHVHRIFLSGYLACMEDGSELGSVMVGRSKVYRVKGK